MAKSLSPSAKTKNGLTVQSWVSPSSKFTDKILLFKSSFSVKLQQIMQISCILPTVPTNYVKFTTKFIHISSMLSGSRPSAENSTELERIKQILCIFADSSCELCKIH